MFRPIRRPRHTDTLACFAYRLFVAAIAGLLLAHCTPSPQGEESAPSPDEISLPETLRAFPRQAPPPDGEQMGYLSAAWGTLMLDNECLRLVTAEDYDDEITSYLIIWPDDYWPGIEESSGELVVYDRSGQIAARVGQGLFLGGAGIPITEPLGENLAGLLSGLQEPIPPECPGPHWWAGSAEMEELTR